MFLLVSFSYLPKFRITLNNWLFEQVATKWLCHLVCVCVCVCVCVFLLHFVRSMPASSPPPHSIPIVFLYLGVGVCLPVCHSVVAYLPVCLSTCLPPVCLSACLSFAHACLPVRLFNCVPSCLSANMPASACLCPCLHACLLAPAVGSCGRRN